MPVIEHREVLIVGGGPAGAVTALLLARAGHDVLLVERAQVPRAKACGDCLSAQTTRVLARLGTLDAVEALRPARLEGWRIIAADGTSFHARFEDIADGDPQVGSALAVRRHQLDAALLASAAAAGAEIRTGVHIDGILSNDQGGSIARLRTPADACIHARLLIGADGLRSVVARRIGAVARPPRLRKLSLTMHVRGIDRVGPTGEMHLAHAACIGIAPVDAQSDTSNFTLVVNNGADALRTVRGPDRQARLDAFVQKHVQRFPAVRGRLDGWQPAVEPEPASGWLASGPFDVPTRQVTADGVALVGDAAGYYDPFTGQGIHQAIAGAEQLAQVARSALSRPGHVHAERLAAYADAHAGLTRASRRVQHMIEAVIAHAASGNAAVRLLAHSAWLRNTLLAVTGDLVPASALLDPRRAAGALRAALRTS